jgi:hypothetical protein
MHKMKVYEPRYIRSHDVIFNTSDWIPILLYIANQQQTF